MKSVMRKYRRNMDITMEELGDMVGEVKGIRGVSKVSRGFINNIEKGTDNCPEWLTLAIAKVLRCDVDTLFKKVTERKTRYVVRKR